MTRLLKIDSYLRPQLNGPDGYNADPGVGTPWIPGAVEIATFNDIEGTLEQELDISSALGGSTGAESVHDGAAAGSWNGEPGLPAAYGVGAVGEAADETADDTAQGFETGANYGAIDGSDDEKVDGSVKSSVGGADAGMGGGSSDGSIDGAIQGSVKGAADGTSGGSSDGSSYAPVHISIDGSFGGELRESDRGESPPLVTVTMLVNSRRSTAERLSVGLQEVRVCS